MPLFAVICRDNADSVQLRLDTRETHLAYLADTGVVQFAGPLIKDGQPAGSLLVIEAESLQAARDWAAGDPYAKAGLFEAATVTEWRKVIG
ncbi:MAG: YciI family protein [Paracoccus sp. (in: a-proteobacteria)]|uniref:YciI family protein n=1 Tax=Paracoccus sp. TaxID=267 RepID=UPI0026E0C062|nr:YciI family protein [Paracoccus sp. (in: a-proteobacteria)]MDO5621210.1 YciI family protein [Paracoccus sp. (in: a-proteobacteria)]